MKSTVDPKIPTPQSLLGYEIAARPMRYHEMVACLEAFAAASDRAVLAVYGTTPTGCRLFKLTISSSGNIGRLAQIESDIRRLGDEGLDEKAAGKLIAELPAVAWMGYGIHGDEISGTDAAIELAYRLLSAQDSDTLGLLDRLIIHLDPMVNPDGRERALAHHTAYSRAVPAEDPQDLFHNLVWPEGRGNHYLFDLNRDAIFTVQAHSRARVAAITGARPQLFVDAHEMGLADSYLFAVPAEPLNPHLPAEVHHSWSEFGADHGEALDRIGTNYYTRSWNEVFYPGFFDIWPSYHGAVPILYEQSATAGASVRLPNGKLRSYREAVRNQLESSLANLATAAARKRDLLKRYWQARAALSTGVAQAWLIPPADAYKQQRLRQLLDTQGVRYEELAEPAQLQGLHSLWDASPTAAMLPAGTLLVRSAQPLSALVRNIFDFHVPLATDFLRRERQGLDMGSKTLLFDATAWSLPLAFGIEAFWSERVPQAKWCQPGKLSTGGKAPATARYGFIYCDPSLRATAHLLQLGVKVRAGREPFSYNGKHYDAGTFLVRHDDQAASVASALESCSRHAPDVALVAVEGARMAEGPDLGGGEFVLLANPAVAILTGAGSNAPNSGALWHLFDVELGMPVSLLECSRLGALDLSPYNTLILADTADRQALVSLLKQGRVEQLKHWIHNGGTLIAMSGSALALAEAGLSACKLRAEVLDRFPPLPLGRPGAAAMSQDFTAAPGSTRIDGATVADLATLPVVGDAARAFLPDDAETFAFPENLPSREEGLADVPRVAELEAALGASLRKYLPRGAYLRAHLKPQHWLGFGVAERLPVLFREADALIACGAAIELVGRYAAPRKLCLSGLVWPEAVGYIAETAYLTRERIGRGQLILFANDPVFRGFSLATQRLLLNAAILGAGWRAL